MASITYRQLFEAVHSADSVTNVENAYEVCLAEIRVHYYTAEEETYQKDISRETPRHLNIFFIVYKRSGKSVVRCKDYFMKDCKEWLDQTLVFNDEIETFFGQHCIIETDPAMSDDIDEDVPGTSQEANMGHLAKNWDTLSHRSKKRKAQNLLEDRGPEELWYATSQGVYKKNANLKYVLKFQC